MISHLTYSFFLLSSFIPSSLPSFLSLSPFEGRKVTNSFFLVVHSPNCHYCGLAEALARIWELSPRGPQMGDRNPLTWVIISVSRIYIRS